MRQISLIAIMSFVSFASIVHAQSPADAAAIKQTSLDYIEGWYEGNSERMERALHPELAKRIVRTTQDGKSRLDQMSAMSLLQGRSEERRVGKECRSRWALEL